jgi:hypothetical protein
MREFVCKKALGSSRHRGIVSGSEDNVLTDGVRARVDGRR